MQKQSQTVLLKKREALFQDKRKRNKRRKLRKRGMLMNQNNLPCLMVEHMVQVMVAQQ